MGYTNDLGQSMGYTNDLGQSMGYTNDLGWDTGTAMTSAGAEVETFL